VPSLTIVGVKRRCEISSAKAPFLNAILRVLIERKDFLPFSARALHYGLLNCPPLRHASKPDSTYTNDTPSYNALVELLTRARLVGIVPMEAISDETRPVTTWNVWSDPRGFIKAQLGGLFRNYFRNLMQSQPCHIELVAEKNTLASIVEPVAAEYTIPVTIGRGYCSLPPRHAMAERYRKSGKDKLVLLLISDHDPDGESIAHSFARSMRDDLSIFNIHPIKVALTAEQVEEYHLPPILEAKKTSKQYAKFSAQYGDTVHEVEALPPAELQRILRKAIDSVIDADRFNASSPKFGQSGLGERKGFPVRELC
jgi:hypothetical protein